MLGLLMVVTALLPATVASAADPASPAEPAQQEKDPNGLEFDVPLPRQRSLKERDPKFDKLIQGIPDLETHAVPFKKAWTEDIVDSFNSQWKDGPDTKCESHECVGSEMANQRIKQLNTDFGPEDDWTWTPPSR